MTALGHAPAFDRHATPRRVGVVWLLLMINVLGFLPSEGMLLPIPKQVGQMITMGSLVLAFGMALLLNPRVRLKPNAFLLMLSALAIVAVTASMTLESGLGSLFRSIRLVVFVGTLWLLCRWWRGDMSFVRFHVRALGAVLLTVVLGIVISPGAAFSGPGDRLVGAVWPIPAPQVGQYCAIAAGLVVMMWLTRSIDGRSAGMVAVPSIVLLLLSHTRTALLGLVVALAVAGLVLAWTSSRARKAVAGAAVGGTVVALLFSQAVLTWLRRGQDESELASLTGRQKVWDALLSTERTLDEQLFGIGLTDKSFNGLPIDNGWLTIYYELGFVGVGIVAAMLVVLLATAALRPPSPARVCAVFLIVYCLVASYTEVGLGDASPYLLHLAVATSLLLGRECNGTRDADETRSEIRGARPQGWSAHSAPSSERR